MNEIIVLMLLGVSASVVVAVWLLGQIRRVVAWLRNLLTPPGVTFGVNDVPLSQHEWSRFAAFATAKNIQQKTLMAEAVKFYLQEKVK